MSKEEPKKGRRPKPRHPQVILGAIEENSMMLIRDHIDGRPINHEGAVVRYYRRPDDSGSRSCAHCHQIMHIHGWIDTKEGGHIVCPGDWVITGVVGELYPCKPGIFADTYEPVVD